MPPYDTINEQLVARQISSKKILQVSELIEDGNLFIHHYLNADLWDKQADIVYAMQTKTRVAVKACHASSKSYTAARIALWWLARFKESIVITTAPTWTQIESVMWQEIH